MYAPTNLETHTYIGELYTDILYYDSNLVHQFTLTQSEDMSTGKLHRCFIRYPNVPEGDSIEEITDNLGLGLEHAFIQTRKELKDQYNIVMPKKKDVYTTEQYNPLNSQLTEAAQTSNSTKVLPQYQKFIADKDNLLIEGLYAKGTQRPILSKHVYLDPEKKTYTNLIQTNHFCYDADENLQFIVTDVHDMKTDKLIGRGLDFLNGYQIKIELNGSNEENQQALNQFDTEYNNALKSCGIVSHPENNATQDFSETLPLKKLPTIQAQTNLPKTDWVEGVNHWQVGKKLSHQTVPSLSSENIYNFTNSDVRGCDLRDVKIYSLKGADLRGGGNSTKLSKVGISGAIKNLIYNWLGIPKTQLNTKNLKDVTFNSNTKFSWWFNVQYSDKAKVNKLKMINTDKTPKP